MSDNRTSEPTEAQIEAAAKAIWDRHPRKDDPTWADLDYGIKEIYRKDALAALVAAAGAGKEKSE